MNAQEAKAQIDALPIEELREIVYDAHKDFYDVKGHWLMTAPAETVRAWHANHFHWDEVTQCWDNTEPFGYDEDDDYEDQHPDYDTLEERAMDREDPLDELASWYEEKYDAMGG